MARVDKPFATNADGTRRLSGHAKRFIYPFFAAHMLAFGVSGFVIAYMDGGGDLGALYMHGGIAISMYIFFYIHIFGRGAVAWMLIDAGLGILGIYAQIGWILERFGKRADDYPWQVHAVPFLYYVLYTFLLHQFLIDVTRSRDNPQRRTLVDGAYVVVSLLIYGVMLWRGQDAGLTG